MKSASRQFRWCITPSLMLGLLCLSNVAFALQASTEHGQLTINSVSEIVQSLDSNSAQSGNQLRSVLQPLRHTQASPRDNSTNTRASFRSESEVIQEVKSRYDGQVVKISLNERTSSYSVVVLLPTGKVKSLQVSARK